MKYYDFIDLPIKHFPRLLAFASDKGITDLRFTTAFTDPPYSLAHAPDVFIALKTQLIEYATQKRHYFDLELDPLGTDYQKKVWRLLQDIPYGETISYKELAKRANSAPRAIGGANSNNPLPIIIPCHRVIHQDGTIGGYIGQGQDSNHQAIHIKQILLNLEKENSPHDCKTARYSLAEVCHEKL